MASGTWNRASACWGPPLLSLLLRGMIRFALFFVSLVVVVVVAVVFGLVGLAAVIAIRF